MSMSSVIARPEHCTVSRVVALTAVCLVVVVCTYLASSPAGGVAKEQKFFNMWRRRSSASTVRFRVPQRYNDLLLRIIATPIIKASKPYHNSWHCDVQAFAPDDLEVALSGAAFANKTLILTVLNKAYAEEDGLLDLFIESLRGGEGTAELVDHVLFVAMDAPAFQRCRSFSGVRCYLLRPADGAGDLSSEQHYMSDGFIRMMWRRIRFLGDVLKHGYSFIFTVSF